ncbi:MAG: hypothetical protein IPP88_13315 [Betaproteobacteria bacterium]|nr:hypothetical protein [Betaproteobacteria bacterium]
MKTTPQAGSESKLDVSYVSDISVGSAHAAFHGVSMSPERRGDTFRAEYSSTLAADYASFKAQAFKGGTLHLLDDEFARYRAGYAQHCRAYLASSSRCISSFITGPSNFPVRRAEKRNNVAHQRLTQMIEFRERARKAIIRALRPDLRPIMAGDADALQRLQSDLDKAEAMQERMKAANAGIRKHKKAGPEAQVAALTFLGFPESIAQQLLKPDFAGRIGFADYELTNNSANVRRIRQRMEKLARDKAAPVIERESESGVRLEDDPPANRVRLFFPAKPDEQTRSKLKAQGFRWSPTIGAWQAYRNHWSMELAKSLSA